MLISKKKREREKEKKRKEKNLYKSNKWKEDSFNFSMLKSCFHSL